MARKSKSVAKHQIIEIAASLKAKAAIPITVSLEQTISTLLAPQIQAMLDAGYTYADVAEVFKSHGVELAASSIKSYHRKQPNVTKQNVSSSEMSSTPDANQSSQERQANHLSDDEDSDDAQIDPRVDVSPPSVPNQNTKTAKSNFNVTDRSKL